MRCQIPVSVVSLDPRYSAELKGQVVVANVHGCCFQSPSPLPPGTRVRVQVGERRAMGRVVNSMPVDDNTCVLGIDLDEAANIWGIPNPPGDWGPALFPPAPSAPPPQPQSAPAAVAAAPPTGDSPELRNEVKAQLARLEKMYAEQVMILREERASARAAREATEHTVNEQVERMRQLREYVESLACSIPTAVKTQAQEQAKTLLQHLHSGSPDDAGRLTDALEAKLAAQVSQLGQQLRRELLQEAAARPETPGESATAGIASLRPQLERFFQERQRQFEAAHQAALAQLQQLEGRGETLVSLVDVELQNHADQAVSEAVAQLRQELQHETGTLGRQQPAARPAEADKDLAALVQRAESARNELRHLLESREKGAAAPAGDPLQFHIEEAKTWSAGELARLRQSIRNAAAEAENQLRAHAAECARQEVDAVLGGRLQELQAASDTAAARLQQIQEAATLLPKLEEAAQQRRSDLDQEIASAFAARQQRFEAACEAAAARFTQLQEGADTLLSMVEVELQKRSDQYARDTVAEVQQQIQGAAAALRQQHLAQVHAAVEGGVSSLLQRAQEVRASLQTQLDSLESQIAAARAQGDDLQTQLVAARNFAAAELEHSHQSIRDLAQDTIREVRGQLTQDLKSEVESVIEARRQEIDSAHQAAISQLRQLQERADSMVSLVDLELQKHLEEGVRDATEEMRQNMARQASSEMARFREMLYAVCAEAGGEIRGRICQAVESASGTLDTRGATLQEQLADLIRKHGSELRAYSAQFQQEIEAALGRVQALAAEQHSAAEGTLQAALARALESSAAEVERQSRESAERWRTVMARSMEAMQQAFAESASGPPSSGKDETKPTE
jgi:hypothetical protein